MDGASFLRVQVWGMFLGATLFGCYLVSCGPCFRVFFTTRSRQLGFSELNWPMLIIFLIFFAKTTSSLGLHLYLSLQMITASNPAQAATDLMNGSNPINISKYTTVLIQAVIASGALIYRCWIVYSRSWPVVLIPLVLWLGGVAVMGIVIHVAAAFKINGFFTNSQSRNFGASFWAIIVVVNIITSALIARRVWRIDRLRTSPSFQPDMDSMSPGSMPSNKQSSVGIITGHHHDKIKEATRIIIDSGLMYTVVSLLTFLLFVANSNAVYAAMDVLVQVIGISFNLIVIRDRPQTEPSLSDLNSVPLQFVSSNMSVTGSAIEFAYPKKFMPRRKNPGRSPTATATQEDAGIQTQQTQSHQSI
ncbi:hypothetical protein DFH07DRAFT_812685 [Mycena maculata]|uniref:Uncharacterized protein n=1 Tax=Mycena maculata TaxID=230809 RepID=A0AAD7JIV3_9AGAR|nr:hypothetical protein DFH07DRAFT_812685 [Mycena maculata]